MMAGGDPPSIPHVASPTEVWCVVGLGLLGLAAGTFMLLWCANSRVRINDEGLSITDCLGREMHRLHWDEISGMKRIANEDGTTYCILVGRSRISLSGYSRLNDLANQIRARSPKLTEPQEP
jgi:hypothetical protein